MKSIPSHPSGQPCECFDAAEPGGNGRAGPHALYRLADVETADRVYLVESKQSADAARTIGLTATSPDGVKNASKTDWTPLANKAVVILPSTTGNAYARDVARLALAAGAKSVRIVPMFGICPGRALPGGYDIAAAAAECPDDDERIGLRMAVEQAEDETPCITSEALRAEEADADPPPPSGHDGDGLQAENHARGVLDIGPPVPLDTIIASHPRLRPPVIDGLLRRGETANIIAHPKAGKSWLAAGLAISVVDGSPWLDTFPCIPGRVLIIDAELHSETIAHRLPMVAKALGASSGYASQLDVWAVRGVNLNLFTVGPLLNRIAPNQYALVILDAFYRFLPPGTSENDNAGVMALYNAVDTYAGRLGAAWVNIHHTSKGSQADKATTDVGSGAGAQSRAADTHLIIRPHEEANVAVMQAVVRSWPPVEPMAIRWEFPAWQLDVEADPTRLQRPKERTRRADKDHLDTDRQAIVNAMHGLGKPETKTVIRDAAQFGNPRFAYAWQSLVTDSTITPSGDKVRKDNGQWYQTFALSEEDSDSETASG